MEYYIGVDLSLTGTGVVIIDKSKSIIEKKLIKTEPSKFKNIYKRLNYIFDELKFISIVKGQKLICIEDFSYGSKSTSTMERAGLSFILRTYLDMKNINFEMVPPKSLKKFATGNGNANKQTMIECAFSQYGHKFVDDNICDAYFLAMKAHHSYSHV